MMINDAYEVLLSRRITSPTGCWLWLGAVSGRGYGRKWVGKQNCYTHRISYEINKGPIKGVIDHLCRNLICFNPSHLEDVTQAENTKRGKLCDLLLFCKAGLHKRTPENIYYKKKYDGNGRTRCLPCNKLWREMQRARKKTFLELNKEPK